jgi:nucleosome binding factor SPN SPT16 subunit
MVGKKKTEDVQFYAEVGGIAEDVERYRRGDDDSDDEELIRAARKKLEKELMEFAKACEEYSKDTFEWEVPVRELGFTGTPYKATSLLTPTKHCLINLTEQPFFVLGLDEVEIAWFERMFSNLNTFDLTFVNKDFERFIRVQAIPINEVEKIKNWLDKSGIIFCDIKRIFDWSKFLAPIRNDFKSFVD